MLVFPCWFSPWFSLPCPRFPFPSSFRGAGRGGGVLFFCSFLLLLLPLCRRHIDAGAPLPLCTPSFPLSVSLLSPLPPVAAGLPSFPLLFSVVWLFWAPGVAPRIALRLGCSAWQARVMRCNSESCSLSTLGLVEICEYYIVTRIA